MQQKATDSTPIGSTLNAGGTRIVNYKVHMGAHELAFVGLAGSSVGTAIGLPMAWPRSDRARDVQVLGIALVVMSAIAGLISARLAGLAPSSAATQHAINLLGMATLPLLIIYTRYARHAPITPAQAWWLTPAVAYAALVMSRAALGLETKVPFSWIAPIVCSYTVAGAITLWRHRAHKRQVVVPAELVIGFMAAINLAQLVRMEFAHIAPVRAIVPIVMSAGFAAMAAFAAWRATAGPSADTPPVSARYERSGLGKSSARRLLSHIDEALTRDRLHTRVDLTLAHLAAAIDATPHQVSEALNRYAGTSFADLLMRHRIDEVKSQLRDPANDRYTIEGIGTSAGFGSRSALYTAFKKLEGVTPTEYRRTRSSK